MSIPLVICKQQIVVSLHFPLNLSYIIDFRRYLRIRSRRYIPFLGLSFFEVKNKKPKKKN